MSNERKHRVWEEEQPTNWAVLRALMRQVGISSKLVAIEAGNQLKWFLHKRFVTKPRRGQARQAHGVLEVTTSEPARRMSMPCIVVAVETLMNM